MLQIQGLWKTKNQNMADLCKEAKELKDKFVSFQINHIVRVNANGYFFSFFNPNGSALSMCYLHMFTIPLHFTRDQ